jgi:hypothetical protein
MSTNKIIINCAGDNELAKDAYDYLLANHETAKNNIDDSITLAVDEIEVIAHERKINQDTIHDLMSACLKSDPDRFGNYTITKLENIFTIGIKTDLLKEMKICEYCGYMSKDYHDMYNHRLFCFSVSRLGG